MSGCEICWERAQQDTFLLGGSVVDHYKRRLDEVDEDEAREHGAVASNYPRVEELESETRS